MERLQTEESSPIAPHEVKELLQRLTAASVEGVPASESRTLAGLSADTGIPIQKLRRTLEEVRRKGTRRWTGVGTATAALLIVIVGGWGIAHRNPKANSVPAPSVIYSPADVSLTGLVTLDQVTWGPDAGTFRADPSFQPSIDLPEGISISANLGNICWGTGDHHAKALTEPLSVTQVKDAEQTVRELIEHIAERAKSRKLIPTALAEDSTKQGYVIQFGFRSYYGSSSGVAAVPLGDDPKTVSERELVIRKAARDAVDMFQRNLRQQASFRGGD